MNKNAVTATPALPNDCIRSTHFAALICFWIMGAEEIVHSMYKAGGSTSSFWGAFGNQLTPGMEWLSCI